jgi:hypothetical protein
MDVAEAACGNGYVLRWYLDLAVYLGPLAVQARSCPGGDIIGEALPGGDEVAGGPQCLVGLLHVNVRKLAGRSPWVPGVRRYWWWRCRGGPGR